jgi:hypothetical protein
MERLTADRIEEDWERALDSASEAVSFCADAKLLSRAYAEREAAVIGRTEVAGTRQADATQAFPAGIRE